MIRSGTNADVEANLSRHEIVVYGATSAGVMAAVGGARRGHSVVLIEPGRHVGGLTSGGLGMTDHGNSRSIGGLSLEFYRLIRRHYESSDAWKRGFPDMSEGDTMWRFEPRAARKIFMDLLKENGVDLVLGERLSLRPGEGVSKKGIAIRSLRMESGKVFHGRVFIDASYEGDLMALAGVSYFVGRESNEQYGETLNGVQTGRADNHQFEAPVDPYLDPGQPRSGLLPGIELIEPESDGTGDGRLQAFCFRLCLTNEVGNLVPFSRPDDYDPLNHELLLRSILAGANKQKWMQRTNLPFTQCMMPNGKTDSNNAGPVSFDQIGMNHSYPEADYGQREEIFKTHRDLQMGMLWFLANDQRVPREVRLAMARWGLPADEFEESGHWPPQLYIRESRRMIGGYVMTEHDCTNARTVEDPVGMGSYTMDSHHVRRYVTPNGTVRNEGDVQVRPAGPYLVGYGSIVPNRRECGNLLVPVCLSASHIAFGSIRMEPVFMVLGHSAATAASLALSLDVDVQDVPYSKLRENLLREGQILDLTEAVSDGQTNMNPVAGSVSDPTTSNSLPES